MRWQTLWVDHCISCYGTLEIVGLLFLLSLHGMMWIQVWFNMERLFNTIFGKGWWCAQNWRVCFCLANIYSYIHTYIIHSFCLYFFSSVVDLLCNLSLKLCCRIILSFIIIIISTGTLIMYSNCYEFWVVSESSICKLVIALTVVAVVEPDFTWFWSLFPTHLAWPCCSHTLFQLKLTPSLHRSS